MEKHMQEFRKPVPLKSSRSILHGLNKLPYFSSLLLNKEFDHFFSCEFTIDVKSELKCYLEEPKLSQTSDLNMLEH
ncbi:hypothetical protein LXL04_020601 [Taraxacum kok-saghyz]